MQDILAKLQRFGISTTEHGQTTLIEHLKGTYEILNTWKCPRYVCIAGLCHSIFGTESFSKTPATLDNREYVQELIGTEAERLAYLFGVHRKESLWKNLEKTNDYCIEDRFTDLLISVSERDIADLITLTLGNWLEQRPRADAQHQFLRLEEFHRSKRFLPAAAFSEFITAYGL